MNDSVRAANSGSCPTGQAPAGLVAARGDPGRIDPRTNRPFGDHGSGANAINYALDVVMDEDCDCSGFLRAWREGDLDEWPEFYVWLTDQEAHNGN